MTNLVVIQNAVLNALQRRLEMLQTFVEERPDDSELRERIEVLLRIMPENIAAAQQNTERPSLH
jgi:hypothetical protein